MFCKAEGSLLAFSQCDECVIHVVNERGRCCILLHWYKI